MSKQCKVINCNQYKHEGDNLFCLGCRSKWRIAVEFYNLNADAPERIVQDRLDKFMLHKSK